MTWKTVGYWFYSETVVFIAIAFHYYRHAMRSICWVLLLWICRNGHLKVRIESILLMTSLVPTKWFNVMSIRLNLDDVFVKNQKAKPKKLESWLWRRTGNVKTSFSWYENEWLWIITPGLWFIMKFIIMIIHLFVDLYHL